MQCKETEGLRLSILSSNIDELETITGYVLRRYDELVPDTEMVCLYLPRNNMEERKVTMQQVAEFLLKHPYEDRK